MKLLSKSVKGLFFVATLFISMIILRNEADAAIANKLHTRNFTVEDNYVRVEESKKTSVVQNGFQVPAGSPEGFTIFNPVEGDPDSETKIQMTLDSIVVKDDGGNPLEFEVEKTESNNYIVKVAHPRNIGFNQNSEIFLTYNSFGLVIVTGAVRDVYIPGFPEDYTFETDKVSEDVLTTVYVPDRFGQINFTSPRQTIEQNGENKVIKIDKNNLVGNSVWIQIGTRQYFEFTIKQTVPKTNNFPFVINTFSMPLLRNINSGPIKQEVFFTEISPTPYAIKLDHDDNLIAYFKTSAAVAQDVFISGYATLEQDPNYSLNDAGTLSDVPSEYSRYIEPGDFWEVDNAKIRETALGLSDSEDINEIVQSTYEFVINQIDYSFVKKYGLNERKGALATLNGGAAVCMEYSDLFITLLRAQGVPARAAFGYGYGSADYESRSENRINHQWAEVYLPKQDTWINVDTTWGYFGNNIIGGDLNHFYSHVSSINPETPSTSELSYFGNLEAIPERDMEITILSSMPEEANGKSQDQVLSEYTEPTGFDKTQYNLNIQTEILNSIFDNFLQSTFSIDSSNVSLGVKLLLCITLPFLMSITVFLIQRNRKRKKAL